MPKYDFDEFLTRMAKLSHREIVRQAKAECEQVVARSYGVRGAVNERQIGSGDYAEHLKRFLAFMKFGFPPQDNEEFQSYRIVIEALVNRGEYLPNSLDMFRKDAI